MSSNKDPRQIKDEINLKEYVLNIASKGIRNLSINEHEKGLHAFAHCVGDVGYDKNVTVDTVEDGKPCTLTLTVMFFRGLRGYYVFKVLMRVCTKDGEYIRHETFDFGMDTFSTFESIIGTDKLKSYMKK